MLCYHVAEGECQLVRPRTNVSSNTQLSQADFMLREDCSILVSFYNANSDVH